jgi:hypothetical protein
MEGDYSGGTAVNQSISQSVDQDSLQDKRFVQLVGDRI